MGPIVNWGIDWVWGVPLIVVTVIFHSFGLGVIGKRVVPALNTQSRILKFPVTSLVVTGGTAVGATVLHGFEGILWAVA